MGRPGPLFLLTDERPSYWLAPVRRIMLKILRAPVGDYDDRVLALWWSAGWMLAQGIWENCPEVFWDGLLAFIATPDNLRSKQFTVKQQDRLREILTELLEQQGPEEPYP
jgi:hypothetical protein